MEYCLRSGAERGTIYLFLKDNKVALVIDGCPANPQIENSKSIQVSFSPIEQNLSDSVNGPGKTQYRKNVVRKIIQSIEKKKNSSKNVFATGHAYVSCSLGCSNHKNCCELFSKV